MFRKTKKEEKRKKYGVLGNALFMLREAKENLPSVIWFAVLDGLIAVIRDRAVCGAVDLKRT